MLVSAVVVQAAAGQTAGQLSGLEALKLILPTDNTALFRGDGPAFYQHTARPLKPGFDEPWEGGRYGFVRNGIRTRWGILYPRFHEGIDIKPVRRSASGEPLDEVRSIDRGVVVYANRISRNSNYGRYVVVEHTWQGAPFYSLYAHLNAVYVENGQAVKQGDPLGLLGYTGRGINRHRAHVHFEVSLLLNRHFQGCYEEYFPRDENHHGIFNGMNLSGVDVARLYLEQANDSLFTVQHLVEMTHGFFRVTIPAQGFLDILWRYPWLSPQLENWLPDYGAPVDFASSWIITFSDSGFPVRIDASEITVERLSVEVMEETPIPYQYLTNGLLSGSGDMPVLSRSGQRLVDFILCSAPEDSDFRW